MSKTLDRPAGLDPQAVWPPKAETTGPITYRDASVAPADPTAPKGLRVGKVPMPPQARVRDTAPVVKADVLDVYAASASTRKGKGKA